MEDRIEYEMNPMWKLEEFKKLINKNKDKK